MKNRTWYRTVLIYAAIFIFVVGIALVYTQNQDRQDTKEVSFTKFVNTLADKEIKKLTLGAEVMQPETGLRPRVFYRNIPGQFIGGTIYDPVEKEVIIGAKVRCVNGGKIWMTKTDEYGDFWFNDLAKGVYNVYIEAKGYKIKAFEELVVTDCINLGDIPIEKK